jgi:23S rRNA (uracil1939-C5)-methyltransferase
VDSFTVRVEKLVYGGDGLAYHDGKPVFVPFVLPGEVVDVFPLQESRKLIRALPGDLKEPAGDRIEARCPYFARCGGCHYQHLDYEKQLALKQEILRETLRRLGRIEWEKEIPVYASPPWNYRNRIQLKLAPHPAMPETLQIGYFRAASHNVTRFLCEVSTLSPTTAMRPSGSPSTPRSSTSTKPPCWKRCART